MTRITYFAEKKNKQGRNKGTRIWGVGCWKK